MDTNAIASFAEHGLAGLVIFALFVSIYFIVKKGIDFFHDLQREHRNERKEWREEASERQDKVNDVIRELSSSIKASTHHR